MAATLAANKTHVPWNETQQQAHD